MQAAGAAEGEQGEIARIEATLHTDNADSALHIGVSDAQNSFGECGHGEAEFSRERGSDGLCAGEIESETATEEV